jgi:sporulation protein YlmC with PRC-barrel domain
MADQSTQTSRRSKLAGRDIYDARGTRVGTVIGMRRGNPEIEPSCLVVETEAPDTKKVLVPREIVEASGDRLVVPYHRDYVRGGPSPAADEPLSEADSRALCARYGLEPVSGSSGRGEGCGLCRRRGRGRAARGAEAELAGLDG